MIPNFEYFLERGDVKRTYIKDRNLAKSLLETAEERLKDAENLRVPKFKLELYKSYSHLADIAYLRKLGFSEEVIAKLDMLRVKRHRSKYYGINVSEGEAKEALEFAKILFERLIEIISKKLE